jgi:hypothetical protein
VYVLEGYEQLLFHYEINKQSMNQNYNNQNITIKLGELLSNKNESNDKITNDQFTSKTEQNSRPSNTPSTKILTHSMTAQQQAKQQQQLSCTKIMYFADLQACILPIIMEWAQTLDAKDHAFYQDWKTKWKDKITAEHGFSLLKKTLGFQTMEDYYEILLQCPAIPLKLHLQYNADEKKIYFSERGAESTAVQRPPSSPETTKESAPDNIKTNPTELTNHEVQYGQSLCPIEHNGHYFSEEEYDGMAAALYEKLSDPAVIPLNYQKYRNIINRYAEENDGYAALYEILEDSHPLLQRDPTVQAPTSIEVNNNLQTYANRFQSYIKSEALNNRSYKPREQVLQFLKGLDEEFQPAVQYINTLMAAWAGRDDLNPLCKVRALPKTIEEFLTQNQPTTSIINRIQHSPDNKDGPEDAIICYTKDGGPKRPPSESTKLRNNDQDAHKSADIYCNGCGMHGHGWRKCDFCAKVIKSMEFTAPQDPTKKKELLETFMKEQTRRRQQKQKATAMGRVLYEVLAQLEDQQHSASDTEDVPP